MFDGTFLLMLGVLALLAALAHAKGGPDLVGSGLSEGWGMLLRFAPVIVEVPVSWHDPDVFVEVPFF